MKKKGSSLITVIIFMMFLMIVGVSALTTTMMDYKARVNESNRIENLYGAESGLEIAYDILLKASDYAINEALFTTEKQLVQQVATLSGDTVDLDILFKSTYFKVLFDKTYPHKFQSSQTIEDGLVNYLLTNLMYPIINENNKLDFKESGFNPKEKTIDIDVKVLDESGNLLTQLNADQSEFQVQVISTFESSSNNVQVGKGERKVARTYVFKVPSYTKSLVDLYPVFNGKALTVDGNVALTGSDLNKAILDVNGDIWVGGNVCTNQFSNCSDSINEVTYQKYASGILLEEANLSVTGNLSTNQTLALRNKITMIMNGNIYARNIYVGKKGVGFESTSSNLIVTNDETPKYEVVLSNDLAINVSSNSTPNSSVEIDKFYGISNKNISTPEIPLDNVAQLSLESSSILVNAEGASVDIKEEAYIGGLAFIDATDSEGNKYQTGESVAVKPNYLAYTMVAKGYEDEVTFRYYNPLLLVETLPEGSSKADYFVKVGQDGLLDMSAGGIKLPSKVYSAGAVVSENGVSGVRGTDEVGEKLRLDKTTDYTNFVQYMNGAPDVNGMMRTVANQILWTAPGFSTPITVTDLGTVILNNNADLKVLISEQDGNYFVQIGNGQPQLITKDIFLVTKGDVELKGNIQLTGNLVVGGHLDIGSSTSDGSLIYNEEFTKSILSENPELFKNLFIDSGKKTVSVESTDNQDYSATTIITKGRWELVK